MKGVRAACAIMVFSLVTPLSGFGQERTGEVTFDRNDRVLSWTSENRGRYTAGGRAGISFESKMQTSLSMTTGSNVKDRWYDVATNRADLTYRLSDKIDLLFAASEDWNRDTMSRLGNSLLSTNFNSGFKYRPVSGLTLNAEAGHVYDDRFENKDSGGKIIGGLTYTAEPIQDVSLELASTGETSNMKRTKDIVTGLGKLAYSRKDVTIALRMNNDYDRRGYFSDIDRSTIEKRKREEQTMQLSMTKGDLRSLMFAPAYELTFNLGRKLIVDSANDDEKSSKYQNNADGDDKGFAFRTGRSIAHRITTIWGFDYSRSANGVERLSRRRTQTDVGTDGSVFFGVGSADSVEVSGMVKRTRIDTPAGVANDRDELKFESGVTYLRHFSDIFKTSLDFRVLETHYVNIDVSQSSQNKWMKTYLFSPSLEYRPVKAVKIEHTVDVYANYISYDYDSDFSPRSNISRRVASESWINVVLSRKTSLRLGAMFEENDYGMLNSQGDKLPAEEGIKRFGNISVEYRFTDWLTLKPNYEYSIRRDWSVSQDRLLTIRREVDQTYGLDCKLFQTGNGVVDVSFRRIVRTTDKYPVRIRNYITMRLSYGF